MKSTWFIKEPVDARSSDGSFAPLQPSTYFCEFGDDPDWVTVHLNPVLAVEVSREDFMRVAERRPLNK